MENLTETSIKLSSDDYGFDLTEKIGNALIDENFYLKIADESVYRFFGEFAIFPITKNIHPDFKEKFIEKVKTLAVGGKDFIILKLRHTESIPRSTNLDENYVITEDQYIYSVIFMEKSFAKANDYNFVNLEIYDILYLREATKAFSDTDNKYSHILELSDDLYFEYKSSTKVLSIFKIKSESEDSIFAGSVDELYNHLRPLNESSDTMLNSLEELAADIKNFSSNFFHIIKTNLVNKTKDVEKVSVKGVSFAQGQDEKVCLGIIKNSHTITSSDLDFLENRANIDSLTGLLNKKAMNNSIYSIMKKGTVESLSVIMMDIDYFKDINDTYGHMFGDEVLVSVSNILKEVVGKRGIIGRVGGDEFLIAIENVTELNELRSILKSIRSKIEWVCLGQVKISTSLGSATYPKDTTDFETLLKLADKCLYIAKEKGRNRFIIYEPDKHGTLSEISPNSKAITMMPKVSLEQKSDHICHMIDMLQNGEFSFDVIKDVAASLKDYYSFDKCLIFFGDNLEPIYKSKNITIDDLKLADLLDGYKHIFDNRNMLVVGNYISVETKNTDLYKFMHKTKNMSSIQYLIKDDADYVKGLISISTYKRANKWSEIDINYLSIIFTLISKALLNKYSEWFIFI